jgi:hypothetical protein
MMTVTELKYKLNQLNEEHRALDDEILHLMQKPRYDQLAVQRLKKKKLYLKDQILTLQMQLIPDIIA